MNPVEPVSAAETASKASKLTLEPVSAEPPSLDALTQRFQTMMQSPGHAHGENVPGTEGPNVVSQVLKRGENMLQDSHDLMQRLKDDLPHLSPAEMTLRTAEVVRQTADGQFRLQAAVTIASGTSKSAQTLLKNQ